jgi:tetratricopeptide (TPR) repeat protein
VRPVALVKCYSRDEHRRAAFAEAIRLEPGHAGARLSRAVCLQTLGQHEQALEVLRECLSLAPADAEARFREAVTLEALGRLEEARCAYEDVGRNRRARATEAAFRAARPRMDDCLKNGRKRLPVLDGELEVVVRVGGDGAVRYRRILEEAGAVVPADSSVVHVPWARHHAALATAFGPAERAEPIYLRAPDAERARRR